MVGHILKKVLSAKFRKDMLTGVLVVTTAFNPLLPTINMAIANQSLSLDQGAQAGKSLWSDLKPTIQMPDTDGGKSIKGPDGVRTEFTDLFYKSEKQDDSHKDNYGLDDHAFEDKGFTGRDWLQSDTGPEGNAYRTLRESPYKSRPDLENENIWDSTDDVFDMLNGKPVDCKPSGKHTPDIKTCEKINLERDGCTVDHLIKIIPRPTDMLFLVDNSGSMEYTIAALRGSIKTVVNILDQEGRDLRLGGAVTRSQYASNNVPLTNPSHFQGWLNSVRINSGATYTAPIAMWAMDRYAWRTSPDVERVMIIIGNDDSPGGDINQVIQKAKQMGIRIYIFHNNGGQIQMGTHLGNGFSTAGMLNMMKTLVDVEESWGKEDCLKKAIHDAGKDCKRSVSVSSGARNESECIVIGGFNVCPGDAIANKMKPSPIPGIPKLATSVGVSSLTCTYDNNVQDCKAYEANPQCAFITSVCNMGTPEEQVDDLFTFGLKRNPSPAEKAHWVSQINTGIEYDIIKTDFFKQARVRNESFIHEYSCKSFTETYDCGYPLQNNSGACAVQNTLTQDFAECKETLVSGDVDKVVKIQSLKTCEEALQLTQCKVDRTFEAKPQSSTTSVSRGCFISDSFSYTPPWAGSAVRASASLNVSGQHTSANITQHPSESNGWTTTVALNGSGKMVKKTIPGPPDKPEATTEIEVLECPPGSSLNATLQVNGATLTFTEKENPAEEANDPCLRDTDDWTVSNWTCQQQAPLNIGGTSVSPSAFARVVPPIHPDIPATCAKATVNYTTKNYGQGEFCREDINGREVCTTIGGSNSLNPGSNSCSALANNSDCDYEGRFPVQGGSGSTGYQYVWEHRYQCTTGSRAVKSSEITPEYTCKGIVSCMGTECMEPNRQGGEDFEQALGLLHALQEVGQDVTCETSDHGDFANCKVFVGEATTCKKALGGWVDCCESIGGGISLGDYITLGKTALKADKFLAAAENADLTSGVYSKLRDPVANALSYSKDVFTSTADNIFGTSMSQGPGVGEMVGQAMEAFKQAVMQGASDFLGSAFGPDVAGMIFEPSTVPGAAEGALQLNPAISGALSVIGAIYTAYVIADLLVNIIWKCSMDELSLGIDKDLKKTVYIGSYCAKKIKFIGCIEKRESYCVFPSPIARIINEQARKQLGISWGSPENPNCAGISLDQLAMLDWDKIDMSEWLDILKVTNHMPGQDGTDIERLTGSGSFLGTQAEAGGGERRKNTQERNEARLDGVNVNEMNQKASDDLWQNF